MQRWLLNRGISKVGGWLQTLHWQWFAGSVLAVGILAGALAVHFTKPVVNSAAQRAFEFDCQEIQGRIQDRMSAHEQILHSAAAFFGAKKGVSRQEWWQFAARQRMEQRLPGIQGLGFALLVPRAELAQHIETIRAEGFPDYQVRPVGDREVYSSIIYLEPFTNRNLRAFGYDMLTESVRRAGLERARDQNAAALSGKVTLVQETHEDVQAGTLMYVPVYRPGVPIETVDQRRAAILGWVYSPYRMRDLMQGILGGWGLTSERQIRLEVFDGEIATAEALLYDSQPADRPEPAAARLTMKSRIVSAGRLWTLQFAKPILPVSKMDFVEVWLRLFGGLSAALGLGWFIYALIKTRLKARQLAQKLNAELRESETRLTAVLQATADGMILVDGAGRILLTNLQFAKLWRIPAEIIQSGRDDLVYQYGSQQFANPAEFIADVQRMYASELERFDTLEFKDGRIFERYTNLVKIDGRQIGRLWSFRDITAHQRAEAALRRTTRQSELLLNSVGEGVYGLDVEGNTTFVNPVAAQLLGYTPPEILGKPQHDLIHHHHAAGQPYIVASCPIYAALKDGEVHYVENEVFWRKDGSSFPVEYTSTPVRDEAGQLTGAVVIFRDVTAQRRATAELRMQWGALRAAANTIVITDPAGKIVWANPAFTQLTGYAVVAVLGQTMRFLASGQQPREFYQQLWKTVTAGQVWTGELINKRQDGSLYNEEMTITPIRAAGGGITHFIAIKQDITLRRLAEEKIQASLQEKEALLKEVHHRVKNNLQIVTSLLSVQIRQAANPVVVNALSDTQARIRSMALLHESLYQGGNLAEIDFSVYVKNLCGHLVRSYGATDGRIQLETQVAAVALNLETAIPCGLLITELVSNALKYAFPAERPGKIIVSLQPVGDGRLQLCVADNGVGFPPAVAPAALNSLGLQLMHTLARQLGGELEHEAGAGTVIRVIFGTGAEKSKEIV